MHRLEAVYFHFCTMTQGFNTCAPTCHGSGVAHIVLQSVTPNRERIFDRLLTFCCVNNEINFIVFDRIGDIRTPFHHLIDDLNGKAGLRDDSRGPSCRAELKAQVSEVFGNANQLVFIWISDTQKDPASRTGSHHPQPIATYRKPRQRFYQCPSPHRWTSSPDLKSDQRLEIYQTGKQLL